MLIVVARNYREHQGDNGHSFQSGIHRFLKDVEITIVLWHSFDVSFLVKSVLFFLIVFYRLLIDYLERRTHLEETSRRIVVTVKDSLDDGFNFWRLNEVKHLQLDCDL